jgi:hypothetical protein
MVTATFFPLCRFGTGYTIYCTPPFLLFFNNHAKSQAAIIAKKILLSLKSHGLWPWSCNDGYAVRKT